MMPFMRTTLDIDQVVLETARSLAASSQKSLGAVISELALKGIQAHSSRRHDGQYPVFSLPEDAKPLDPTLIRALIEEDGLSA